MDVTPPAGWRTEPQSVFCVATGRTATITPSTSRTTPRTASAQLTTGELDVRRLARRPGVPGGTDLPDIRYKAVGDH